MADDDLISGYLAQLRTSLRWRADVDDLVCEADDHLRCAAVSIEARGLDATSAQRQVLLRFGDATVVARAFAQTSQGGHVMPTPFTRAAGTFAFIAALCWFAAVPMLLINSSDVDDWEVRYYTFSLVLLAASACTTVAFKGMLQRSGGRADAATVVATLLAVLATVLLGIAAWAWLIGVALLTGAAAITLVRMRSAGVGSRVERVLMVVAWPIAVGLALALDSVSLGPVDSYGDRPMAQFIGFSAGSVLFAGSLLSAGRWLRAEEVTVVAEPVATNR